jgi:N-acetylmuramoyl-L-alanine amidase
MAPDRKRDPGARFDWRRLARRGLSVWPEIAGPVAVDSDRFRKNALSFGYPEIADEALLHAFRLRFRPAARGPLDGMDCAMAAALCGD